MAECNNSPVNRSLEILDGQRRNRREFSGDLASNSLRKLNRIDLERLQNERHLAPEAKCIKRRLILDQIADSEVDIGRQGISRGLQVACIRDARQRRRDLNLHRRILDGDQDVHDK